MNLFAGFLCRDDIWLVAAHSGISPLAIADDGQRKCV
jgi:hypothetical protein